MRALFVCGFVWLTLSFPVLAAPEAKKPASHDDSAIIAEKLLERIDLEDGANGVTLKDMLEMLQSRAEITILLDKRAIALGDGRDPQALDNASITLPSLKNVRVETVLRLLAEQIDADFYIAPDHVKITSTAAKDLVTGQAKRLPELYHDRATDDVAEFDRREVVRATPYVTVAFKETTLADAVKELASRAGRNIVISEAAAEKAKVAITVSLSNTAFETAAASLAEAAGLRALRNGNVVMIVTAERAKQLDEKLARLAAAGVFPVQPAVDTSALEAKVKELEDKIKELEKPKK